MNGRRVLGALLACLFVCIAKGEDPLAVPKELKDVPASNFCKVVEGTATKDGRMAAAVGFLHPGAVDWAKLGDVNGDYALPEEVEGIASFLVDLKKDRILAVLRGKHYGTRATYNHERYRVAWSEDGRYLVEARSWKWQTETATLYALNGDGAVASSMDLLPVATEQLRIVAERDHKVAREKFEDSYKVSLWKQAVDAKGRVILGAIAEVPKSPEDDPSVSALIHFTAKTDGKGKLFPQDLEAKEKDVEAEEDGE